MKSLSVLTIALFFVSGLFAQQEIVLQQGRFHTGDQPEWKTAGFDDSGWKTIESTSPWEYQGYPDYDGYAWYRFHFILPSSLREQSYWKDSLRIFLNKIDDNDETYLNGVLIGKTEGWQLNRNYRIAVNNPDLHWDAENVIAVRVFDGDGAGGIYGGNGFIRMVDLIDGVRMHINFEGNKGILELSSQMSVPVKGTVVYSLKNPENNKRVSEKKQDITLNLHDTLRIPVLDDANHLYQADAVFTEVHTGKFVSVSQITPYILTPAPAAFPRINSAGAFGVRPGSPFLYKIAATGDKPLIYSVTGLPAGLKLDPATGIITGVLTQKGEYSVILRVSNKKGSATKKLIIRAGDLLALTPPMGWNSWNCWGLSVNDNKVKASAQALIDKGLIDHGWIYINIDDGWEKPQRDANGFVVTNEKFPDMKGLGDWLHSKGLKFGIYSSPGPYTCGRFLGSYQHEAQDAQSYASWGIDYLKYDWCSYGDIHGGKDTTLASYQKPYFVMRDALRRQNRDILFSLCQYGMKNVWEWGDQVDGNCWRTTGDIEDSWGSMSGIGFSQTVQYKYAKPGRWNDPDMLTVGRVGWGENLHPTRLTPDEQYTHISLWSLLSSPLLIGCDINSMDDFTVGLLSNDEVIAVNQDILGHQAQRYFKNDTCQVWSKKLEDGSQAVGIFNTTEQYQTVNVSWKDMGVSGSPKKVRDLWRQKDLGMFNTGFSTSIPPHGVRLIKVK